MSCEPDKLKDLLFGELNADEEAQLRAHARECAACREELERLSLTRSALQMVPDEEPPRRIGFVSDKVFEPSWWSRLWQSGPRLGFASAAMLSLALVVHAAWRPAPVAPVAAVDPAVIEARVNAEVARRLEPAIRQAVAEMETRQAAKTTQMLEAARKDFDFERQADRAAFQEAMTYLQKKYSVLYRLSANMGGGQP